METTSTQTPTAPAEPAGTIPVIREYIGIRPGYCGGKPHILGHRIKVKHIAVMYERMGLSPVRIVEDLPTISLAQVHAALAYFYAHREEVEAEIQAEEREYESLKAKQPSILERIRERTGDAQDDPISSG